MSLLSLTHAFLAQHDLARAPGLVAVSGGADSVALAHVLTQLQARGDLAGIALVHLNHCLRGSVSDEDERFVQALPGAWHVPMAPVYSKRQDVAALAKEKHWNLEDAGRRARYAYFAETAKDSGVAWVATGHTLDDQAETVLQRLLRGAGLKGLGGMPPVRPLGATASPGEPLLIRPLLTVRRAELRCYLNVQGIRWRDDSSNDETRFQRNRVRQELLPLLERNYNSAIVSLLGQTAEQARDVQSFMEDQAADLLVRAEKPRGGDVLVLDCSTLRSASTPIVREMFRLVWQREHWPLAEMGWLEWQKLVALVGDDTTAADLPGRIHVRRKGAVLQLYAPHTEGDQNLVGS